MKPRLIARPYNPENAARLQADGFSRPLAQVLAARGVNSKEDMETALGGMIPPSALPCAARAAEILADALAGGKSVCVVGDYDCDGATASAVAMKGLAMLGFPRERIRYFVPDRLSMGYGLSPAVIDALVRESGRPDLIVTVDNGTASIAGVDRASELGIEVIVTDHHLPGEQLPDALCLVNPNGPGRCPQLSSLAGVGVFFYVLAALRAELRRRGAFAGRPEPNLASLLDLVALGTVADVVPLDRNNRILVAQGLRRMRSGRGNSGISALYGLATQNRRCIQDITVKDLGFCLAPRINAAGRIASMNAGIECLLAGPDSAEALASGLETINQQRKTLEQEMQQQALRLLRDSPADSRAGTVIFGPQWHQGLVGLIASRLKDHLHHPVIAFAPSGQGLLRGSGRSVAAMHLRDCLARIDADAPGLLVKYGGHSQAAGLTIREKDLARFRGMFEERCRDAIGEDTPAEDILTDGALSPDELHLGLVNEINGIVWGQNFDAPLFVNRFNIVRQSQLRGDHLKLTVETGGQLFDAIYFRRRELLPASARLAYRPEANEWQGRRTLQLVVSASEP